MSSFFLFLSVSARKATSLCVAYLSRLSAFDQETRHFQNCRLNVKRQLADSPICRTARHMPPLMHQAQAWRQHHLQNRTDPTKNRPSHIHQAPILRQSPLYKRRKQAFPLSAYSSAIFLAQPTKMGIHLCVNCRLADNRPCMTDGGWCLRIS